MTVGQPTPSVAPFSAVSEKSPLKEADKPKPINAKDDKAPTKLDDKPKSLLDSVKPFQQEYSDDESDEVFGIPKPQDMTVGQPIPSVAPFSAVSKKSPLKEADKPKPIDIKDDKGPTTLADKSKSPLGSEKPIQQEYSDDESDEEFGIPKPQDMTVGQPTPSVAPFSAVSEKSPLKEADKPKPINAKDGKAPTKLDDKPKSPLVSVKPIQQEYSDDKTDEEFRIPKPQDKTFGQPTPSATPVSAVSEKSPLKEADKPKPIDIKDDKAPTTLADKSKSPLGSEKPIQQEYSDDESDEEFGIPKPQDMTVGQPTPSTAPFSAVSEKSPLKEADKPKPIDAKYDKAPTKLDDKPKSPLDLVKPIQQEYSDDESDEEFGIPKPQDKTVGQPTPSVAPFSGVDDKSLLKEELKPTVSISKVEESSTTLHSVSTIFKPVGIIKASDPFSSFQGDHIGDKSPLKEDDKPKPIDDKDDKAPTKQDDKSKSPLVSVKPFQQEYSDDESDEEFGILKPQDMTVGQPTPSVAPFSAVSEKSPLKEADKPKPNDAKYDKAPTKLDDKPKSTLDSVKPIQQEYSDDESDEEFGIPKPQDKTVGQPTPSVAPFSGVDDKSLLKEELKPTVSISKVDESSTTLHSESTIFKSVGIIKPSDPVSSFQGDKIGDKSPLKEDDKPMPIDDKDVKAPIKLDDKPKSHLGS
ncbi:uncharacterized protein LOC110189134, partial [Drosophila serrata]|uniref:uncharacterized protein LOC110189134 n=1 Tax=Drosophila serrata TaxID=7274 RepID=UPI000A1D27F0